MAVNKKKDPAQPHIVVRFYEDGNIDIDSGPNEPGLKESDVQPEGDLPSDAAVVRRIHDVTWYGGSPGCVKHLGRWY